MYRKIYSWLFCLYPEDFRKEYGNEALQLFCDRFRDETGLFARLRLWFDVVCDLAISLPREHIRPRTVAGRERASVLYVSGGGPRRGALLAGAILSLILFAGLPFLVRSGAAYTRSSAESFQEIDFLQDASFDERVAPYLSANVPTFKTGSIQAIHGVTGVSSIAIYPESFRADNVTVKRLIEWAFRVYDYQIQGAPGWLDSEKYRVVAKASPTAGRDEIAMMLQGLLRDRLKLQLGWHSRQITVAMLDWESGRRSLIAALRNQFTLPAGAERKTIGILSIEHVERPAAN